MPDPNPHPVLKRQLGLFHAVLLGLGSILGTGVFVSIGIAAGFAGPSVLIAIALAAVLALCNGLSSAQLAAAHPVAGGTYEYGCKYLTPRLGFTAGWMFLLAKSTSAATAALGAAAMMNWEYLGEYFPKLLLWSHQTVAAVGLRIEGDRLLEVIMAEGLVVVITAVVLCGIRRSAWVNAVLVFVTVAGLFTFFGFVAVAVNPHMNDGVLPFGSFSKFGDVSSLFMATSFVFVALTGYGRIATLAEEVHRPRTTIPAAILITISISAALYLAVGLSILYGLDNDLIVVGSGYSLLQLVWVYDGPMLVTKVIAFAGITAMLGVLLNLVLGLSRVVLAMARRHDIPGAYAVVGRGGISPKPAIILVAMLIILLVAIGDIKTTWSFSAFTVLIYYGITNLAALKLPKDNRLYPRIFAWAGLGGCLFRAWWVEPIIWMIGTALIAVGLIWHALAPRMFGPPPPPGERCVACGYDLRASSGACPECGTAIVTTPAK